MLQQNLFMPVVVVFGLNSCSGLVHSKMFEDVDLGVGSHPSGYCSRKTHLPGFLSH